MVFNLHKHQTEPCSWWHPCHGKEDVTCTLELLIRNGLTLSKPLSVLLLSARYQKMPCTRSRQVTYFDKLYICLIFEFSKTFFCIVGKQKSWWDSWGPHHIIDLKNYLPAFCTLFQVKCPILHWNQS